MLNAEQIKKQALGLGVDEVSIGNIERWQGAPIQQDPRQIMPECRSVIAMGFRVMRGSLRGIEEGTFFSNYSAMGYGGITYLYMPLVVINLSKYIEDEGYEAIPYGHQSDWRGIDGVGNLRDDYSRPVAPGRAAPDVMVNLRIAAYLAGLGEIGRSKMFLSPRFGPRCRVGIVLTEMELEPDPVMKPVTICDRCMACVKNCPVGAMKQNKSIEVHLGGHDVSWNDIDCEACDMGFCSAKRTTRHVPDDKQYRPAWGRFRFKRGWWTPFTRKPRHLYNTGQAVCGARGCTRARMIHLEESGKLGNTLKHRFRRRKPWRVDWTDYETHETGQPANQDVDYTSETD